MPALRAARLARPVALALVAVAVAAPAPAQEGDREIRIDPPRLELDVEARARFSASVVGPEGAVLAGVQIRWIATTDGQAGSEVISVGPDGTVTALRPGTAQVAAVTPDGVAYAEVRVRPLPVATLALRAPAMRVLEGTGVSLWVLAEDRLGGVVERAPVRFESSDPGVAAVDESGRVQGVGPGAATISAAVGEARAAIDLEVVAAGDARFTLRTPATQARTGDVLRYEVIPEGGTGPQAPRVYPEWFVSGPDGSIEAEGTQGVFVAEEPGRYRVVAVVGDAIVRTATVDVTERTHESRLVGVGRGAASTHHSGDVWVFEGVNGRDYAYIGTFMHDWMKVWDVTDPASPMLTDSLQLDARRINDVKIHPNNRIGIVTREGASNRRNGMVLLDLADPAHPTVMSVYEETVTGGVHNVWIDGDNQLVYACHNGTSDLHIIDISDPENPTEVGRWGLDKQGKTLHDVIVQDGYAYLSYWDDGVVILDVGAGTHGGTPRDPAYVSSYAYPIGNTHVAWRAGRYLFLGDEIFPAGWNADRPIDARGYIHVVDVSDLENPVEVAWYEVPEAGAHNVWVEDERLYVGYYQAGLRVVDISGELRGDLYAQGREIAAFVNTDAETTVPNWPMAWGAQIHKGNIFSSDLNSGLWITRLESSPRVVF